MTPLQFKKRLARLGLGTKRAAVALQVSVDCVMHWKAGRRPVPGIASVALDAIELRRKYGAAERFFE